MILLIHVLLLGGSLSSASSSVEETILKKTDLRFKQISTSIGWKRFVQNKKKFFVEPNPNSPIQVSVEKEELETFDETFTLGWGYQQIYIKAPLSKVKKLLQSPLAYQALYNLDGEVNTNTSFTPKNFTARIFKKVPLLPNQDYTLKYTSKLDQNTWFQRAKQIDDKENFAIRDNLKALIPLSDSETLYREVSMVYVLKWYVRAMGPQMRQVMANELKKTAKAFKCIAEGRKDNDPNLYKSCWKN